MYEGQVKRNDKGAAYEVTIPTIDVCVEFEIMEVSLWNLLKYGEMNAFCSYNRQTKAMSFHITPMLAMTATDEQMIAIAAHEYAHFVRRDPEIDSAHLDTYGQRRDNFIVETETDALASTWVGPRLMADMLFHMYRVGFGSPKMLQRAQIMDEKAKELGQ